MRCAGTAPAQLLLLLLFTPGQALIREPSCIDDDNNFMPADPSVVTSLRRWTIQAPAEYMVRPGDFVRWKEYHYVRFRAYPEFRHVQTTYVDRRLGRRSPVDFVFCSKWPSFAAQYRDDGY